jgi:glycosyltransferase involved in cell wall biosynthesis
LIIPAYNEARRLPDTLDRALNYLQSLSFPYELIIVENASEDETLQIARQFANQHSQVRVLHENKRGKGNAVRTGMLVARGEYLFMADADLSMPVEAIGHFLPPVLDNYDVAIGSREIKGSVRYNEPVYRHIGGRMINLMIRLLALPGLHDTQCGFKCFRAAVAEDLFLNQTMSGWSFDVELLYIARMRGYKIVEVPVNWYYRSESKVNPVKDALKMIADILYIRRNARRGMYDFIPQQSANQARSSS